MLVFESWPPEAGKIEFGEHQKESFREVGNHLRKNGPAWNPYELQARLKVFKIAEHCGHIIGLNSDPYMAELIREDLSRQVGELAGKDYGELFSSIFGSTVESEQRAPVLRYTHVVGGSDV